MSELNLISVNEDGTLNFGDYSLSEKTKKPDFQYAGDIYKVKTFSEITKLEKNEMFVYESVPGTRVTNFTDGEDVVEFEVEGTGQTQIILELESETEYQLFIDGVNVDCMKTNLGGKLVLGEDLSEGTKKVRIEKISEE